jgi:hypothetical protein
MDLREWRKYIESQIDEKKKKEEKVIVEEEKDKKRQTQEFQREIKENIFKNKEDFNRRKKLLEILMDEKIISELNEYFLNLYKRKGR